MDPLAPDRWADVDALFEGALARPPDERTAFLRAACGDDPALYRVVTALLESEEMAENDLGESATAFAARLLSAVEAREAIEDLPVGTRVGPYRVVRELGRGGMGAVYLAARADGTFHKHVALKLVKRGMDTDEVLRRFHYERQVLAGLDHGGIARLLDAGAAADGRPYLVMEHVEGTPITAYADARRLGLEARLNLFAQVCEAVRYAHRRLVVHRDLKPSNILVAEDEQGAPQVKLLDFGIARLLDARVDPDAPATRPEHRLLTPEYAAPEQRRGEAVTTAADVYALGVVLYELLAGRRPDRERRGGPERPSAVLARDASAASARGGTPESVRRRLRGDLDTFALAALHEDPARRYPSAEALLDDLQRYRARLPLRARPDSAGYRAGLFVARHRVGVAAAAAFVVLLVAAAAALAVTQRRTAHERDAAEATAALLEDLFAAADPFAEERQDTLRVRALLDRGAARLRADATGNPLVRARLLHVIGQTYLRMGQTAEAEPLLREAVALRREAPSSERAASLVALAAARHDLGAFDEAEALAREALALYEEGDDPAARAEAESRLALILRSTGPLDESEALHRAALDRLRAARGPDDAATLAAQNELAMLLMETGRFAEAEPLYRDVIARLRRLDGGPHPRQIPALTGLAFLLQLAGRLDEAAAVSAEEVALVRASTPGSGRLALALTNHSTILRRQGHLDEAERLLEEALALPLRRPQDRALPLGSLATLRAAQGDLAGAEATQREALAVLRATYGGSDPVTASSAIKLAGFLRDRGKFEEAEDLLLDAYAAAHQAGRGGGPHGPLKQQGASALAALYVAWGRPDEAARYQSEPTPLP